MTKVFVICGHGGGDPGACANGFREADQVRKLAARMQALGGSEVQVGDTSRNWYKDNGIGRGDCPAGVPVIELHMDSAGAGAKGGHVIIKEGFDADAIDNALAAFIGGFLPGRSKAIVGRSDLANPNRAAAKGVNYRLVECGFISDAGDARKFEAQMDDLARGILACFGVGADAVPAPQPPAPTQPQGATGSTDDLARRVIAGEFGTGEARKAALGARYGEVQARVNQMLGAGSTAPKPQTPNIDQLARDVIAGKYGTGEARKKALGANYAAVQARVNQMLGAGDAPSQPAQSLDAVARAVIRGDYGNGADRERRLRAAGYDPAAVQRRVNQLL